MSLQEQLNAQNYGTWRVTMEAILKYEGLWKVITQTKEKSNWIDFMEM